jgi:hypothetical protein
VTRSRSRIRDQASFGSANINRIARSVLKGLDYSQVVNEPSKRPSEHGENIESLHNSGPIQAVEI